MRYGTMGVDFEERVNFDRLRRERLKKTREQINLHNLGALLCLDYDNIRYITSTRRGEWGRDKMSQYVVLPKDVEPLLFDAAAPAKKISAPWIAEQVFPTVSSIRGTIPPEVGIVDRQAKQVRDVLKEYGVLDQPLGMDITDVPLIKALEKLGIEVVDGQQTMLDARSIKTKDEIELMKTSAAIVDAAYEEITRALKPGIRENDLVAIANKTAFTLGAERVEWVNCVSGTRAHPHPHDFSDRIIRPRELVFLDIGSSFMGYMTCYYRTLSCGRPTSAQVKAYERAWGWLKKSIEAVKPGATTADVARCWPPAEEFGFKNEEEAFRLQFGHAIGLSHREKPSISRWFSLDTPSPIKEGMVFALETYCPSEDGKGSARIEEEVVVTKDGCEKLFKFPCEKLIASSIHEAV